MVGQKEAKGRPEFWVGHDEGNEVVIELGAGNEGLEGRDLGIAAVALCLPEEVEVGSHHILGDILLVSSHLYLLCRLAPKEH